MANLGSDDSDAEFESLNTDKVNSIKTPKTGDELMQDIQSGDYVVLQPNTTYTVDFEDAEQGDQQVLNLPSDVTMVGPRSAVLTQADTFGSIAVVGSDASNVDLIGFTVDGNRDGAGAGNGGGGADCINFNTASDCSVVGVKMQNAFADGIDCDNCQNIVISKCIAEDIGWAGFYLNASTDNSVVDRCVARQTNVNDEFGTGGNGTVKGAFTILNDATRNNSIAFCRQENDVGESLALKIDPATKDNTVYGFKAEDAIDAPTAFVNNRTSNNGEHHYCKDYQGGTADERLDNVLTAAGKGNTIYLESGTYSTDRTFSSNQLTLIGAGKRSTVVDADWTFASDQGGIERLRVADPNTISITSADVHLMGLDLQGSGGAISTSAGRTTAACLTGTGEFTFASGANDGEAGPLSAGITTSDVDGANNFLS